MTEVAISEETIIDDPVRLIMQVRTLAAPPFPAHFQE
jgi:hypothetical protein